MTEIRIDDAPEQHTAVVHEQVPMAELLDVDGLSGRAEVRAEGRPDGHGPLGADGVHGRLEGTREEVLQGFPVATPIEDADGVVASTLPGGEVVEAVHIGPYDTMETTYAEIAAWMAAQGLRPGPVMWESYLTDPGNEPDPATWRTLIVWPTT